LRQGMSALGYKRTFAGQNGMSTFSRKQALHPGSHK